MSISYKNLFTFIFISYFIILLAGCSEQLNPTNNTTAKNRNTRNNKVNSIYTNTNTSNTNSGSNNETPQTPVQSPQQQPTSVMPSQRLSVNKPYAITVLNNNVVRFHVEEGDYAANGNRAEVEVNTPFAKHYEFSFRPTQYNYQNDFFIIANWHIPNSLVKYKHENNLKLWSPFSLLLSHDSIVFLNKASAYIGNGIENLRKDPSKKMEATSFPLLPGWNYVSIDIDWADNETGKITLNINQNIRVFNNIRTTYDMNYPNYFKAGIYRSGTYKGRSIIDFQNIVVDKQKIVPDFNRKAVGENHVVKRNGLDTKSAESQRNPQ